jgi:hypothetical protein
MTIQRQYSLPNCKLVLQGLNHDSTDLSGRPLLAMVTNVECYLGGQKTPIVGGKEFLESLTQSVSDYAQGYLSGIQHLIRRDQQQAGSVQIQQVEPNLHRLTVQPETGSEPASEVNLTTVQLFDLVEAVDQLFADAQTLPDLSLQLNPISKRHILSSEPLTKRAAPAALGITGLAAAAAVLFMLPVPEVRRPESASESTSTEQASPLASPPTGSASPPTSGESAPAEATNASPPASPIDSSSEAAEPETATTSDGAGVNLTDLPEITDPSELDQLTVQLYDKLDLAWRQEPTFDGELNYRVGVNRNGDIVGYKYANDAALTYLTDTPLADVQFAPPTSETGDSTSESGSVAAPTESIAQFRVVFKSDGVLEVSPWNGQADSEDETITESEAAEPTN